MSHSLGDERGPLSPEGGPPVGTSPPQPAWCSPQPCWERDSLPEGKQTSDYPENAETRSSGLVPRRATNPGLGPQEGRGPANLHRGPLRLPSDQASIPSGLETRPSPGDSRAKAPPAP